MNPVPRSLLSTAARLPLAAALALSVTALPASAHPGMHGCGGDAGGKPATINVQGDGRASVAPDLATVSLGVTTQAPTAAQAMADNAARQTAIIEALREQGIAPADLQTQGLNLSPMQDFSREGQPPVITGYQAQNIVTARVRDLARLGPMLDSLVAAGATDVQGISFSREDSAATEDRARVEAVAEARRRAEVIAGAAGMELGPLVSLTDTSMTGGPRPMAMMARAADAESSTPIEAGELMLTAQVTGVWKMVPAGGAGGDCGFHGGSHGGGHMGRHGHGQEGPKGHHGMMPHGEGPAAGPGDSRETAPDAPGTGLAPAPEPLPPVEPQPAPLPGGADAGGSASPAPGPDATGATESGGATSPDPAVPATEAPGAAETAPAGAAQPSN